MTDDARARSQVAAAAGAPSRLNAAEAFARAAAVLKAAPAPLRDEEDLLDACLPYIGDKTRRLVAEFLSTGAITRLERHRSNARTVAAALFARIPWVGAAVRADVACGCVNVLACVMER
jgi:hypothetical protein